MKESAREALRARFAARFGGRPDSPPPSGEDEVAPTGAPEESPLSAARLTSIIDEAFEESASKLRLLIDQAIERGEARHAELVDNLAASDRMLATVAEYEAELTRAHTTLLDSVLGPQRGQAEDDAATLAAAVDAALPPTIGELHQMASRMAATRILAGAAMATLQRLQARCEADVALFQHATEISQRLADRMDEQGTEFRRRGDALGAFLKEENEALRGEANGPS